MDIAIRVKSFQFEKSARKMNSFGKSARELSGLEQNAWNLQKGPSLQVRNGRCDPCRKFPVGKKRAEVETFLKKVRDS